MYLLLLSQENIELSSYEAVTLLDIKNSKIINHLLFCDIGKKYINKISRLAYTKKAFELIYLSDINFLKESLLRYDWSKIYKKNFCLRIHSFDKRTFNEADYAKYIWRSLVSKNVKPAVDLDSPHTLIEIFIINNQAYICRMIHENIERFEDRKAHMRPALHPTAMHPKLARALINILNPKKQMIDPFCGAGGLMLEACLMGIKAVGYDIDKMMIRRAEINLKHYTISKRLYDLKQKDATKINNIKYVVTDLPYGLSSKKSENLELLYSKFIRNISGKSVIVFPDFVDFKSIVKKNLSKKLELKKIVSYYVHKTLTRIIVVIDKK